MKLFSKLRRKKILLIDDDEWIRDSLGFYFEAEGCHLSALRLLKRVWRGEKNWGHIFTCHLNFTPQREAQGEVMPSGMMTKRTP